MKTCQEAPVFRHQFATVGKLSPSSGEKSDHRWLQKRSLSNSSALTRCLSLCSVYLCAGCLYSVNMAKRGCSIEQAYHCQNAEFGWVVRLERSTSGVTRADAIFYVSSHGVRNGIMFGLGCSVFGRCVFDDGGEERLRSEGLSSITSFKTIVQNWMRKLFWSLMLVAPWCAVLQAL